MNERIASAFQLLPDYLARHVLLCAAALALGVILALPLAIFASRTRACADQRWRWRAWCRPSPASRCSRCSIRCCSASRL